MPRPSSTLTTSSTLAGSTNQKYPVSPEIDTARAGAEAVPFCQVTSARKRFPARHREAPPVQAPVALAAAAAAPSTVRL